MQVRTRMIDHEQYESFNESGMFVTIDMRADGVRSRQNPPELLLSALTACASVDIVGILKKRKRKIEAFDIITEGTRRSDYPRAFTDIHCEFVIVSPDVTVDELLKAAQLSIEKYCTVAASLRSNLRGRRKSLQRVKADHPGTWSIRTGKHLTQRRQERKGPLWNASKKLLCVLCGLA